MAEFQFGKDAVLYYSATLFTASSGSGSASTLLAGATEFDKVVDLDLGLDPTLVDATSRAIAKLGWDTEVPASNKARISFGMNWVDGNTIINAIRDSALNKTEIAFVALTNDRATATAQGLAGNWIAAFSLPQPVKGIMVSQVTLNLASFPHWYVVP
jgi:hypothetical protein